jgi:nucleotide-binding universal stress UspA family protein
MFSHILIPLDGSHMAESALTPAAYLAERCGAGVTLMHIMERKAPQQVHGERHLTAAEEAKEYLQNQRLHAFPGGIRVAMHVHETEEGNVAQSIVQHARELSIDLIIMCTHGHKRLDQVLFGTIAQQVIALGETPVLILHPAAGEAQERIIWHSILVPLDGNPEHEQSIPVVLQLARICAASIHLVMSVPTYGTLSGSVASRSRFAPAATSELLEMAEEDAEEYLRRQVERLQKEGCEVTAQVSRGDPATEIARAASKLGVDLIIMGTHGKIGSGAFWSGSVTPAVFNRAHAPLLLVPVT